MNPPAPGSRLGKVAHRIRTGSAPKHDQLLLPRKRTFRGKQPVLISALGALIAGEIAARGLLSRPELDRPQEVDGETAERFVLHIRMQLRKDYDDFVLGRGSEPQFFAIPAYLWSLGGAICERDLLWVRCAPGHEAEYEAAGYDERARFLRIDPYLPPPIERPYTPEQLTYFADVQVSAADLLKWQRAASAPPKPGNERNAGRKGWERWPAVRAWIRGAIDDGAEWESLQDLCDDLRWEGVTAGALRKHLDKHDPEFRERVRAACKRKQRK